uniref:Candidate secreted effector n=1 Tax=Meloidogyne incognita TaxID=6306 RepID=A0A914MC39_MELIC
MMGPVSVFHSNCLINDVLIRKYKKLGDSNNRHQLLFLACKGSEARSTKKRNSKYCDVDWLWIFLGIKGGFIYIYILSIFIFILFTLSTSKK